MGRSRIALATLVLVALIAPAQAARVKLRKPARGLQARITRFQVPPASEREVCEFRRLPNRKAIDVQAFDLNMTHGSHHFVVWEYLGREHDPSRFPTQLVDSPGCVGVGPSDGFVANANLFGMQTSRGQLRFPPGVAVRLEPHAFVFLNLHIRNSSATEPLTADAVFNFRPARPGTVKHHAQALTVGNVFDIRVPARGTQSITSDWHAPLDLNVVQLSTHQHKRGTYAAIRMIDAAGNDLGPLFEANDWEHPGERWFDPVLRVPQGQGFRFTCEWANPDDRVVTFGATTEDEMCFMTGYFYPDDESVPVNPPGCLPQGAGVLCFVGRTS